MNRRVIMTKHSTLFQSGNFPFPCLLWERRAYCGVYCMELLPSSDLLPPLLHSVEKGSCKYRWYNSKIGTSWALRLAVSRTFRGALSMFFNPLTLLLQKTRELPISSFRSSMVVTMWSRDSISSDPLYRWIRKMRLVRWVVSLSNWRMVLLICLPYA